MELYYYQIPSTCVHPHQELGLLDWAGSSLSEPESFGTVQRIDESDGNPRVCVSFHGHPPEQTNPRSKNCVQLIKACLLLGENRRNRGKTDGKS